MHSYGCLVIAAFLFVGICIRYRRNEKRRLAELDENKRAAGQYEAPEFEEWV